MLDPRVLFDIGPVEAGLLRAASAADAGLALATLCRAVERDITVDDEMLTLAGTGVGDAGHVGADGGVLGWLSEGPSDRRAIIASAVLQGYWAACPVPPAAEGLRVLEGACDRHPVASSPRNALVLALTTALARTDLSAEVRRALRAHLLAERDQIAASGRFGAMVQMITEHA